jgi:tetratricopeptide (TPR) repeat protein
MLGNNVTLSYDFFARNWQSFSYRYMVIYKPEDEKLLRAIVGDQWNDAIMRRALYERTKAEALAWNTNFAWLAYGEAAYSYGMFEEAVAAFDKGLSMGSSQGVFGLRNSYPQALRALGRQQEADKAAQTVSSVSTVPATVAAPPDPYALLLAMLRVTPFEQIPTQ